MLLLTNPDNYMKIPICFTRIETTRIISIFLIVMTFGTGKAIAETAAIDTVETAPVVIDESESGPWNIHVKSRNAEEALLYHRLNDGEWQETEMSSTGDQQWEAELDPGQLAFLDRVAYYVLVKDSDSNEAIAPAKEEYFEIGVTREETRLLSLNFESGEGIPLDGSAYQNEIIVHGEPEYVETARSGDYAMRFQGEQFLESLSPFLSAEEFSISFWWYAEETEGGDLNMMINETETGPNYSISWGWSGGWMNADAYVPSREETVGFRPRDPDTNHGQISPATGTWYRSVFEFSADRAYYQIRDENNLIYVQDEIDPEGLAGTGHGPWKLMSGTDFNGVIVDDVEIYNYFGAVEDPDDQPFIVDVTNLGHVQNVNIDEYEVRMETRNVTSAVLHYRTNRGEFEEENFTYLGEDEWTAYIPGNELGTIIDYYVVAEDDHQSQITSPENAEEEEFYYEFAMYHPESKVLDLGFNEGSGNPVDASDYEHEVRVLGNPQYDSDAASGAYSMYFDGDEDALVIDNPVLSSGNFTLDFMFKPEEMYDNFLNLVIKEGDEHTTGSLFNPNYRVNIWWDQGVLEAQSYLPNAEERLDEDLRIRDEQGDYVTVEEDNWYRILYEFNLESEIAIVNLWNQDGELLGSGSIEISETAAITRGPLTIGGTSVADGNHFRGWIDDLKIYNYGITTIPPDFVSVTDPGFLAAVDEAPYVIEVEGNNIDEALLHYNVNQGDWQEVVMSHQDGVFSAEIPQMAFLDIVNFYVSARSPQDERRTFPSDAEENENYLSFGIYESQTKILDLRFDEGEGVPKDYSDYMHELRFPHGGASAEWLEESYPGSESAYSLHMPGDSTFLQIDSPFLGANEYTIDIRVRPQRIHYNQRLIIREGGAVNSWWAPNYQIFMAGDDGNLRAGPHTVDEGLIDSNMETNLTISAGNWYRMIHVMAADSSYFELRDKDGFIIERVTYDLDGGGATYTDGPLKIGYGGPVVLPTEDNPARPFYHGEYGSIQIWNYAHDPTEEEVSTERNFNVPDRFTLKQNYPNPFNPETRITYSLPRDEEVTLTVHDMLGREITTLVDRRQSAGVHTIRFDASGLASGVYLYRIHAGEFSQTRKMLLVK